MKYKAIFLDWDDTIGDFSRSAQCALTTMFEIHQLYQYTDYDTFVGAYNERNNLLWEQYGRDEVTNEDSSAGLDSVLLQDPDKFYKELRPWLIDMQPLPNALPLRIDARNESLLRDIAALLHDNHVDYVVIVPPRFRSQPLSPVDHALMCEIMGDDRVNDFSNDSTLIHDLHSYYDGVHILTYRCSELIDRSYAPKSPLKLR